MFIRVHSWLLWFAVFMVPAMAQACSVCFGDPDSDLTKGLNAGVFALLLVVCCVLAGFASFFVFVARRASLAPQPKGEARSE